MITFCSILHLKTLTQDSVHSRENFRMMIHPAKATKKSNNGTKAFDKSQINCSGKSFFKKKKKRKKIEECLILTDTELDLKKIKQGRIHGSTVADDWAGAEMRKPLAILKIFRTDGLTKGVESRARD